MHILYTVLFTFPMALTRRIQQLIAPLVGEHFFYYHDAAVRRN